MEYKDIFGVDFAFTAKAVVLLGVLTVLPNVLGMVHITAFGYRVHFFQIMVFLSAFIYGPLGGAVSGAAGSVYTCLVLNNPYILIGNVILGFSTGLLFRKGIHPVLAAMGAYIIQIPWLWVSDIYWAGMPQMAVEKVVIALLVSNLVWALVAWKTKDIVKKKMVD